MAVSITSITPPRGREGDSITILGAGFNATMGNNTVTIGGVAATVTGIVGTTELTVTVPAGLGTDDYQVAVTVTNTGDATSATRYWFVMKAAADLRTHYIQAQQPGPAENIAAETDTIPEAKDYERLAGYVEALRRDAGGSSIPNQSSGAERIGTAAAAFSRMSPARDTVQAVLEALYLFTHAPNSEALTADKTMAAGDRMVQALDPGTAARDVNLPLTSAGFFVFINTGTYALSLKHDGVKIGTVNPSEVVLAFSDGAFGWTATDALLIQGTTLEGGSVITFGASGWTAGQYAHPGQRARTGSTATLNYAVEVIVPYACTVAYLRGTVSASPTGVVFKTWKNGAEADTINATVTSTVLVGDNEGSTAFAQGDRLALELDAVNLNGYAYQVFLLLKPSTTTRYTSVFTAGGSLTTAAVSWGPWVNAPATESTQSDVRKVDTVMPAAGTIKGLSYSTASATSSTQLGLRKNGASAETLTCTGSQGFHAFNTSVASGDRVGVYYISSVAPGAALYQLWADIPGQVYSFGGDVGASTSDYFYVWGKPYSSGETGTTSDNYAARAYMVASGVARSLAINKELSGSSNVTLVKNGATDETVSVASTTPAQVVALANGTRYARGDYAAINNNGADYGEINFNLYISQAAA